MALFRFHFADDVTWPQRNDATKEWLVFSKTDKENVGVVLFPCKLAHIRIGGFTAMPSDNIGKAFLCCSGPDYLSRRQEKKLNLNTACGVPWRCFHFHM